MTTPTDPSDIVLSIADGVAELRLNRPHVRNALSVPLLRALRGALHEIEASREVRVVVLTGVGKSFCAGADLTEMDEVDVSLRRDLSVERGRLIESVLHAIERLEQPTLALVQGAAAGGGWGLALACDMTWAAAGAVFVLPEVAMGMPVAVTLGRRLAEVVGPQRAAAIAFGGERLASERLAEMGAVTRIVAADDLHESGLAFARTLAGRDGRALTIAKMAIRSATGGPPPWRSDLAWPSASG